VAWVSGIYAIHNVQTGEAYIGQTANIAGRFVNHRWNLARGTHTSRALQEAWDADGPGAFGLVILERVGNGWPSKGVRRSRELIWLARARAAGIALYNDQVGRGRREAA